MDEQLDVLLKTIPPHEQKQTIIYLQERGAIPELLRCSPSLQKVIESFDLLAARDTLALLRSLLLQDTSVMEVRSAHGDTYMCCGWGKAWVEKLRGFQSSKAKEQVFEWASQLLFVMKPPLSSLNDLSHHLLHLNGI